VFRLNTSPTFRPIWVTVWVTIRLASGKVMPKKVVGSSINKKQKRNLPVS